MFIAQANRHRGLAANSERQRRVAAISKRQLRELLDRARAVMDREHHVPEIFGIDVLQELVAAAIAPRAPAAMRVNDARLYQFGELGADCRLGQARDLGDLARRARAPLALVRQADSD